MTTGLAEGADLAAAQRRTLRVLTLSQVLGGVGVGAAIGVGGLIAEDVSGSTALAGLSQTATVLGAAVLALPMARVMGVRGRRPGLMAGYVGALVGAGLVALGSVVEVFVVVLVGACLMGAGTTTNLQARFAATDLAVPAHRARALSTVVWATTIGVVAGPNLTGPGGEVARWLGLPRLAGPLVFSVVAYAAAAAVVQVGLRPDPLLAARSAAARADPRTPRSVPLRESLASVRQSPLAVLALAGIATAHTVMVAVMVMTPVHMRHHDASLEVVGVVISLHVAGMYAFSPVVGWLADRTGRMAVLVLGMVLLVAAVSVAGGAGGEGGNGALGVGLLLLGLGWSCALVASSTLLTESVPEPARPGVQGASDFVMGICGAAGGALSGVVLGAGGYGALNVAAGLLVLPVLVMVGRWGVVRRSASPRG